MNELDIVNHARSKRPMVSIEGRVDGVEETELEYEFYGRLESMDELRRLATETEHQEQYELKKPRGKIRVRACKVGNQTTYVMTSKTWTPGQPGENECEVEVSVDMFEHFKHVADSGMIKTRYTIPAGKQRTSDGDIVDIKWEYDVFEDRDGKRSDWVKVDLEVKEVLATIPDLPVALADPIMNQKGSRTPKEVTLLTKLFKEEFTVEAGEGNVDQDPEGT